MDQNLTTLAQDAFNALMPVMPYLLKVGEKALEKTGDKIGDSILSKGQALWNKIWPSIEAKPAALEAAQDAARLPDDADAQAAFRIQLKKIFSEDESLRHEIATLMSEHPAINISATGDRSIAAQDISQSVVNTGDNNVVLK